MRSLDLSLNRLAEGADERTVFKKADHRGIDALADVLRAPDGSNIEYINLSWCQLDSTALKQLVNKGLLDAKSNGKLSLVRLDLSNNCLDGRAAEALANFFKAPYKGGGLAFMPPTQKKREGAVQKALTAPESSRALRELYLGGNPNLLIDQEIVKVFCEGLTAGGKCLRKLALSDVGLESEAAGDFFADVLNEDNTMRLRHLDLSSNRQLGSKGGEAMIEGAARSRELVYLSLADCGIGKLCAKELSEALVDSATTQLPTPS